MLLQKRLDLCSCRNSIGRPGPRDLQRTCGGSKSERWLSAGSRFEHCEEGTEKRIAGAGGIGRGHPESLLFYLLSTGIQRCAFCATGDQDMVHRDFAGVDVEGLRDCGGFKRVTRIDRRSQCSTNCGHSR